MSNKFTMKLFIPAILSVMMASTSCKKDAPFIKPYTVPPTYNFSIIDSSATARIIMWQSINNYLATAPAAQLNQPMLDSLWLNNDSTFTPQIVNNYIYTNNILNRLTVNLASAVANADSIKNLADSVILLSGSNNTPGAKGIAGWQMAGAKLLFDARGVEMYEVFDKAMMGVLAMRNTINSLTAATTADNNTANENGSTAMQQSWDVAYNYVGLPKDYDAGFNYNAQPVKADRPLGIAALFARPAGDSIYAAFRRSRAAIASFDYRIRDIDKKIIERNIEKTLGAVAISYLDAIPVAIGQAQKLHLLSQAYGIIWGLQSRPETSTLSADAFGILRQIFKENFYDLIADVALTKINSAKNILVDVYGAP